MTAQQQLAELLANDPDETFDQSYRYIHFIRECGAAIAELIEAAREVCASAPKTEPVNPESSNHDDTRDFASDWADWYTANQLRAALRKLTQEA